MEVVRDDCISTWSESTLEEAKKESEYKKAIEPSNLKPRQESASTPTHAGDSDEHLSVYFVRHYTRKNATHRVGRSESEA